MNPVEPPSTIRSIEALLVGRIGLEASSVSPSLISRGVRNRMVALGIQDVAAYEARLRSSPAEVQELVEEVVIPESWFFRDERPFHLLKEFVTQRLTGSPSRPPVRILSIPCARGEEPFSIAMALRDAGLDPRRFRIDGVDVGARNIELARKGFFTSYSFRGDDLGFRDRYFQPRGSGYQIDPSILGSVRFHCASVLDPELLASEPPYDVIFCRNLLIYLTPQARAQTLSTLDRLLRNDGILFVGHADRLGLDRSRPTDGTPCFASYGDSGCFAYGKAKPAEKLDLAIRAWHAPVEPPEPREFFFESIVASPEPAEVVSEVATPIVSEPRPLLEQARELADLGRCAEAIRLIEKQLQAKGPNAPAFHLMGVLLQSGGDRDKAERCFSKAVYLDPDHDEALLALALLADRRGDVSAAASYRRRAQRARTSKGVS